MENYFIRNMNFFDINPVEAGYEVCKPGHVFGYAVRRHYLIHYVVRGTGVLYKNDREYQVNKGQAFLIKPGEATKYCADLENPWEYIWIGFDGKVAEELEKLTEPVFQINGAVFEKIKNCKNYYNMRESYLVSCIHLILCQIFESAAEIDVVSSIKNYIDANYMYNIKISDIAKDVNLDRKYLARIYKLKTGYTMKKHIIKKRMEAAKNFLGDGYNVNETAELTGYSEQASFSRAYKKYFGTAPKNKL